MIIWINGAFGAGKTTTAHELHQRIDKSFLFDPERIGFFLRKNVPSELQQPDFQNMPAWRELTFQHLLHLTREYKGPIIVPMTIVNEQYYQDIIGKLRDAQVEVHHFTIMASKETLLARLRKRGNGRNSWAAKQIERCVEALQQPTFEKHIYSDALQPEQMVELIAEELSLTIKIDHRSKLKKMFQRILFPLKR